MACLFVDLYESWHEGSDTLRVVHRSALYRARQYRPQLPDTCLLQCIVRAAGWHRHNAWLSLRRHQLCAHCLYDICRDGCVEGKGTWSAHKQHLLQCKAGQAAQQGSLGLQLTIFCQPTSIC